MRKLITFLLALLFMLVLVACNGKDTSVNNGTDPLPQTQENVPNALLPQIMIDGTMYYLNGESPFDIEVNENDYSGRILSVVPLSEQPIENNQANFGTEGEPYIKYENGFAVKWGDKWSLFVTEDILISE